MARWPSGLRRTVQATESPKLCLGKLPCLERGVGSNPTLVSFFLSVSVGTILFAVMLFFFIGLLWELLIFQHR